VGHGRGCGNDSSGFGFYFDVMDVAERITTLIPLYVPLKSSGA
jgi:hypothetical protein